MPRFSPQELPAGLWWREQRELGSEGGMGSLDPRALQGWLAVVLVAALAGGGVGLVGAGAVALGAVVAARAVRAWMRVLLGLLPLAALVAALDAVAGQGAVGVWVAVRLLVLATVGFAFAQVADGEGQVAALRWLRVPYAVSFVLVTGARSVPAAAFDLATLRDAARLRGITLDGPPWRQLGGWRRILVPLLVLTIRRGMQLGEAMEARAFGAARRTIRHRLRWRVRDTLALAAAVVFLVVTLVTPHLFASVPWRR